IPDGTGRDDSGILIEYKGHRILNTVDCSNLEGMAGLPEADVLMTSFAGGSSGYPVCYRDLYGEREINLKVTKNRISLKQRVKDYVRAVSPKAYIPIAGYFTEAFPGDEDI